MKRPYLKHPLIVIGLLIGGWLALLLPVYLSYADSRGYETGEVDEGYLRYIVVAFLAACFCLIPVIIGALFLWLKRAEPMRSIDSVCLCFAYMPTLCIAFLSFCDALSHITKTPSSTPAALIYYILFIYLTFGFPSRTGK